MSGEFEFPTDDLPEQDMGQAQDNQSMGEVVKLLHQILAKLGSKGSPYPYPAKKNDEAEAKLSEFKKKAEDLDKKVKDYEAKEHAQRVEELLNAEEEKGIVTKEARKDFAEKYKNFSADQIGALLEKTVAITPEAVRQGRKAPEPSTDSSKDNKKKLEAAEQRFKDFKSAGLSKMADEIAEEIKTLKGAGE